MARQSKSGTAREIRVEIDRRADGEIRLKALGHVHFGNVEQLRGEILEALRDLPPGKRVQVDLGDVRADDSSVAGLLIHLKREVDKRGLHASFDPLDTTSGKLLALVDMDGVMRIPPAVEKHRNLLVAIGDTVLEAFADLKVLLQFIGRVTISLIWNLRHPWRIRWGEVAGLIQRTGTEALPIVALLSLLVGLVTAFSSAIQLRNFGANIFIANLIGIGMTREMGPLLAAILLTGRSGSSFAAEIGTMKISDEVDALTVMGVKPLNYLVMPRILAVMLTLPLLTLFSDLFGIIGGLVIGILSLDLTPIAFLQQLHKAIGPWDVYSGVLKALFFGILVAGVGCYRGMETAGGALGVGRSTTSSVVSGIFLIVVADSLFVIVFHYLGVG